MKILHALTLSALAFVAAQSAEAQAVKWHPGHYVMLASFTKQSRHFAQIDEIRNESAIQGIQLRLWWYELEKSKGQYDFSRIDAYLQKLKSMPNKKRLVVRVMDRRFNTNNISGIIPDYLLKDSIYKGGLVSTKTGFVPRLWEQPVMDRLIALYQEIGRRYDSEALFEGIATTETAHNFGQNTPAGYSVAALAGQYKRFASAARETMPRSNLFLYTNWLGSDDRMQELIQSLIEPSVAVGGPNTVPGKPTSGQKVWSGQTGADFRGRLAISSGVDPAELGGVSGTHTPKQIYDYAYDTLHVNYMFWSRNEWNGGSTQKWTTGILPFLRSNPPVHKACPATYGICSSD
jgi:hypothetical protein